MRQLRLLRHRLRSLFRRNAVEDDLARTDELRIKVDGAVASSGT
jgi:hypothetical protein